MNKNYFINFLESHSFEENAKRDLVKSFDLIFANEDSRLLVDEIVSKYNESIEFDYSFFKERVLKIESICKVHNYCVSAVVLILLFEVMHKYYQERCISEEMFFLITSDIKYKVTECKLVKGIYGTFVDSWYINILKIKIFAIGRLQFEIIESDRDIVLNDKRINRGDKIISIHIPRSGEKLDHELVVASYKKAAEFFAPLLRANYTPFVCDSWLIHPIHREFLSDSSNIIKFMNDFTLVDSTFDKDYGEIWRLFDKDYEGDFDKLPSDSTLRRKYIEYFKNGGKFGVGYGVYLHQN